MLHKNEQYIVIGCIAQFPTHKNIDNYFQVIGYFYIKAITLWVKLKIETDQIPGHTCVLHKNVQYAGIAMQ